MANIVIFSYSNVTWTQEHYFDSFVTGFVNTLSRCGNNILNIDLQNFINNFKNEYICDANKSYITDIINSFSPDIIITFNNMIHDTNYIKNLECPIVLYPADGIDFFWFKSFIHEELERYFFLNINEYHYKSLLNTFHDIKEKQLIPFGYVTDFHRKEIEQDINLSFLGSIPNHDLAISRYLRKMHSDELNRLFYNAIEEFRRHPDEKFSLDLPNFKSDLGISLETVAVWLITCRDRFQLLSELFKHGLKLYGYSSFLDCCIYNYEFINHYCNELCVTQEQSETLYNRSKISLNLPNARAVNGFSWRVPDILASQSVLLSFNSPDLHSLTKKYLDLPMYHSPEEAKELVKRLLKDDIWRHDISIACNEVVESHCRFEHYFQNIENATGIKIFNKGTGSIHELYKIDENLLYNQNIKYANKKKNKLEQIKKELIKTLPYFIAKKILHK